jgi:hypothetical protein
MSWDAATRRQYSGINVLILWGAVMERGYPAQSWLTFRQSLSLGGNVRKGERGTTAVYVTTVVYADRFVPEDEWQRPRETALPQCWPGLDRNGCVPGSVDGARLRAPCARVAHRCHVAPLSHGLAASRCNPLRFLGDACDRTRHEIKPVCAA